MIGTTHQQWAQLIRAAAEPAVAGDPEAVLRQAVALGHQVAPGTVGCSITSIDGDRYVTPAYSHPLALDLDQAQYQSGDGPCMAAAREHRYQSFDAATDSGRFPGFTGAAIERGVRSSISLPLSGTPRSMAINIYSSSRDAFDAERPQAIAALLARCVSALLSRPAGEPAAEVPPAGLVAARQRAALIADAEAALMRQRSVSRAVALAELMRRSRDGVCSIFDVARDVAGDPGRPVS